MDLFLAMVSLIVLSPLLVGIFLLIRLTMGTPVFFRQERAGLGGRPFQLLKFRTMNTAHDAQGSLLPDEERLTRLGRFLRQYSLDELPQLWNICIGDMSFVGPRPLLAKYLPCYSAEQARRHEVRPGLTGWAQVSGRNALGWDERFKMDVWYVQHRSLWLDIKIIWKTVGRVFQQQGISMEGHATMPEFTGSRKST